MGGKSQTQYNVKPPEYFSYFGSLYPVEHNLESV